MKPKLSDCHGSSRAIGHQTERGVARGHRNVHCRPAWMYSIRRTERDDG
jgi:hypothetical protein